MITAWRVKNILNLWFGLFCLICGFQQVVTGIITALIAVCDSGNRTRMCYPCKEAPLFLW